MLRRTLLLNLGPLMAIFLLAAVASIVMLHGTLDDLDHLSAESQPAQVTPLPDAAATPAAFASAVDPVSPDHFLEEHQALARRFRLLVLGLTVIFLLVLNVGVILLVRTAGHILRPVDALVRATELLAQGHLDHRVTLPGRNEFAQLAGAFNDLAERLQLDERRKIEVLHQLALTLNHELNNCIAVIDLQLRLLTRKGNGAAPSDTPAPAVAETALREITDNLRRMTRTVEALKHVRRIVLTDYIPGMKMLDLEQSTRAEEEDAHPPLIAPPAPV